MEELSEFLSRTNIVDSPTTVNADIAQTTSQTTAKPSAIKSEKDVSHLSILHTHNALFSFKDLDLNFDDDDDDFQLDTAGAVSEILNVYLCIYLFICIHLLL